MIKYRTIRNNKKIILVFDPSLDDDPENSDWLKKIRKERSTRKEKGGKPK